MKVLHVISSLSPVHGGPSAALSIMEGALRERGICVETATTNDDGPGRKGLQPLGQAVHEGEAVRWYFDKSAEFYKVSFSFRQWLKRHIRNYDLVHIYALFSYASAVAAREAFRAGVPYIIRLLRVFNRYGMTAGEVETAGAGLITGPEVANLTENLLRLLADEALRARLSTAGRQFAEAHYSLEVMRRHLVEMYEEILIQ